MLTKVTLNSVLKQLLVPHWLLELSELWSFREFEYIKDSDEEKASLQKSISLTSALLTEKDAELEKLRNEVGCCEDGPDAMFCPSSQSEPNIRVAGHGAPGRERLCQVPAFSCADTGVW